MIQQNLFGEPDTSTEVAALKARRNSKPMARATDPETSHKAAANHAESGKKQQHIEWVTDLVWKHPRKTPGELAVIAAEEKYEGLDYIEIQRRVSECTEIHRGDKRRCTVKKTMATELLPGAE